MLLAVHRAVLTRALRLAGDRAILFTRRHASLAVVTLPFERHLMFKLGSKISYIYT